MEKIISYKKTVLASYIGNFTQAIAINLTPILFIPLREQFGLTYSQFGTLVLINFIIQVATDIIFSKAVDKFGFRPFIVTAHFICAIGLVLFALAPILFAGNVFIGFVIATVIFSASGGLLELLLSPIVDAIPTAEKSKAMAMLHSFYAWGQVAVVVVTTIGIYLKINWQYLVLFWALVPFINTFLFAKVPLAKKVVEGKAMSIRALLKSPIFILAFFAIVLGGASEITMVQWSSTFMQNGLGLPKIVGDILGMCGFALMLGVGRVVFGIMGDKLNLSKIMIIGSFGAVICYAVSAISPFAWLSVLACAVTGLCVSLLWPGVLVVASKKLPLAGTSMFALLAAGGDIGAAILPYLTGFITDDLMSNNVNIFGLGVEQSALRIALLITCVVPLICGIVHIALKQVKPKMLNNK